MKKRTLKPGDEQIEQIVAKNASLIEALKNLNRKLYCSPGKNGNDSYDQPVVIIPDAALNDHAEGNSD